MSNTIEVPTVLMQQKDFCLRISECNRKMFEHIDYLRKLITSMHQIYHKLCKKIVEHSDQLQRQLMEQRYMCSHGSIIFAFIKKINSIHLTMFNQLSSNTVTLGTKTYKIAKNRLQLLQQKLLKCNQLNIQYFQRTQIYNEKQQKYQEKCQYFSNYEKDVMKYYSLRANYDLYQKIRTKQDKLREKQQTIIRIKDQYTANISQIRISVKEFFQMERLIVVQYKKLLFNIRKGAATEQREVYNDPIIQVNQQGSESLYQPTMGDRTGRSNRQKESLRTVTDMRQSIIKQFQSCQMAQELFDIFLKEMSNAIVCAGESIDEMRLGSDYRKFISDKIMMMEILSGESISDIDAMINQIAFFRMVMLNVNSIFSKTRILSELKKYRRLNYQRFIDETNHYIDIQKRDGISSTLSSEYFVFENKYLESSHEYTARFRDKVFQFQNQIVSKYFSEESRVNQSKNRVRNQLFQKKYYQILMNPIFLKHDNYSFSENKYLAKFGRHLSANKIRKIMTMTDFFTAPNNKKTKTGCCGFLFSEQQGHDVMDDYHCALKDGLILIQGKLRLYKNYIMFSSNFNSKTLFGYSDIRIPKWQILNFGRQKHLLSLMLVIQTTHGNMEFTSFISDPFQKIYQIYDTRKSGISTIGHGIRPDTQNQLQVLEQCFQRQLQGQLKRVGIIVDKLSTYLSDDHHELSISIEYHPQGVFYTLLFEIKINLKEISLEYFFIHDEKNSSADLKNKLQEVAKEIINSDPDKQKTLQPKGKALNLSYSMIAPNQTNRLSIVPSFLEEGNQVNQDHHEEQPLGLGSALELANLLSSRANPTTPDVLKNYQNYSFEHKLSFLKSQNSMCHSRSVDQSSLHRSTKGRLTKGYSATDKNSQASGPLKSKNSHSSSSFAKGAVSSSFIMYFLVGVFALNIFVRWLN